ncbi:MAG: hypothetical protein ACK58N_05370 [Synechocystis sp.]
MSSADRKRKILDHLNKRVEKSEFLTPKTAKPSSPEPSSLGTEEIKLPEPMPVVEPPPSRQVDRKRRVMTHVNQSSGDFGDFSLSSETGKKKVLDHIRKSLT